MFLCGDEFGEDLNLSAFEEITTNVIIISYHFYKYWYHWLHLNWRVHIPRFVQSAKPKTCWLCFYWLLVSPLFLFFALFYSLFLICFLFYHFYFFYSYWLINFFCCFLLFSSTLVFILRYRLSEFPAFAWILKHFVNSALKALHSKYSH